MHSQFTQQILDSVPGFDFVAAHFECERDRYSADNPTGFVNLGSAQNFLMSPLVHDELPDVQWALEDASYQSFSGTDGCRTAVAKYLQSITHNVTIDPNNLVIGNGLVGLLEALSVSLLNANESVLIPTPVFPGLVNAITTRTSGKVTFVPATAANGYRITPHEIELALLNNRDAERSVRAILICSPGNPIGQVFTKSEIEAFVQVADAFDCTLIVDEIYASSCFDDAEFYSAASVPSDRVFVLGGMSKDFGIAGYATGWMHTTNQPVLAAMRKQSHYFRLPAPIQSAMQSILELPQVPDMLEKNRNQLTAAFQYSNAALQSMDVPVVATVAGLVVWLDLRKHLKEESEAGQLQLYRFLLEEHRVHLSPGNGFYCSTPGYFRMCFSHPEQVMQEGLKRLRDGLAKFALSKSTRQTAKVSL